MRTSPSITRINSLEELRSFFPYWEENIRWEDVDDDALPTISLAKAKEVDGKDVEDGGGQFTPWFAIREGGEWSGKCLDVMVLDEDYNGELIPMCNGVIAVIEG